MTDRSTSIGESRFAARSRPNRKSFRFRPAGRRNFQPAPPVLLGGRRVGLNGWITDAPVPLDQYAWRDLSINGITDMGAAMREMARELSVDNMPDRSVPPVIILLSDGQPTDDFKGGLAELMREPWGQRAVRISIAIGESADLDVLQQFIGHSEIKPLVANNSADLVNYIRWVSTAVLQTASAPASQSTTSTTETPTAMGNIADLTPPQPIDNPADTEVW